MLFLVPAYFVLNSLIQKKVRQQFAALGPNVQIRCSAVHANLLNSSVSFDSLGVHFIPYKSKFQNKHEAFFTHVSIKGIHFLKFLLYKKLEATSLSFDNGTVRLDEYLMNKADDVQDSAAAQIQSPSKKLFIRAVSLNRTVVFLHSEKSDRLLAKADLMLGAVSIAKPGDQPIFNDLSARLSQLNLPLGQYQIQISDVTISSKEEFIKMNRLRIRSKGATLQEVSVATIRMTGVDVGRSLADQKLIVDKIIVGQTQITNDLHTVTIAGCELDRKKEMITVNHIHVIPQYGKYEFARKLGHQADRIMATISKIEIVKPDIDQFIRRKIIADKIEISESDVSIFRDRRLPLPKKNIPLPVDYIRELPFNIRVKTIAFAIHKVEYEEYPKAGYGKTGILVIENIKGTLTSFINHPAPNDPAAMIMNVQGAIMGSGTAHGVITMPLEKNKPYHIKGAIERLELTKLNSSSENLGKIRIKSGFLDYLSFDFMMNEQRSTGNITGAYHHLVIQPLKKHTEEKNIADAASFMLRRLVIPFNKDSSMPIKKRTGMVDYQRDPQRMVSQYFLQSLLMGVKKSFALGFLLPK